MRRLLAVALAAGLLGGCTGRTAPLPIRDGLEPEAGVPNPDASSASDASTGADASVLDADIPDTVLPPPVDAGFSDAGSNLCAFGPFTTELSIEAGDRDQISYSGPARLVDTDPLRFRYGRDRTVVIRTRAPIPDLDSLDEQVWLDFGVERPWWTNAAFALRELGPAGPGELRMLVWSLDTQANPFDLEDLDLDLEFVPSNCQPSDTNGCGESVTLDALYSGRGADLLVPPGAERSAGDVRIGNGRSFFYVDGPTCTDTPNGWFEGYLTLD